MADTLNMREASISEITNFIRELISMDIYDPVIILGKMGMGKTASLKELTQQLGIGYCELRLVNMTETDMLGIPTVSADGTTTYASNDLLPRVDRDGEVGILALDEITSCSAVMRAAAYQLLDGQRALGNYKLPKRWLCVGLGNGPDDGGVFNGAEAALFTRCYGFRVAPDVNAWKSWAIANDMNPTIVAYLGWAPDKLHVYNADELDGLWVGKCPTPRTWEKLSKLLNAKEARNGNRPLPASIVDFLAAASIGEKEAGNFSGFYDYNNKGTVINPDDILNGNADGSVIANLETQVVYITMENLIKRLNGVIKDDMKTNRDVSDACMKKVANAVNWVLDGAKIRVDYAITGLRDLVNGVDEFTNIVAIDERFDTLCPRFLEFANENSIIFSIKEA